MAENNQNASAGNIPAKPKPAAPGAAKPAAPGAAKPATQSAAKPAASQSGVFKPQVDRPAANPYKDSKVSPIAAWFPGALLCRASCH